MHFELRLLLSRFFRILSDSTCLRLFLLCVCVPFVTTGVSSLQLLRCLNAAHVRMDHELGLKPHWYGDADQRPLFLLRYELRSLHADNAFHLSPVSLEYQNLSDSAHARYRVVDLLTKAEINIRLWFGLLILSAIAFMIGTAYYWAFAIVDSYGRLREFTWSDKDIHRLTIRKNMWMILIGWLLAIAVAIYNYVRYAPPDMLSMALNLLDHRWYLWVLPFVQTLILSLIAVRFLFWGHAMLIEDRGPLAAAARSWKLTSGRTFYLFLTLLLLRLPLSLLSIWRVFALLPETSPSDLLPSLSFSFWGFHSTLSWIPIGLADIAKLIVTLMAPILITLLYVESVDAYSPLEGYEVKWSELAREEEMEEQQSAQDSALG